MASLERFFQPSFAFAIVMALALSQYAILVIYMLGGTPDFIFGGDFIAFWSAARETLAGNLSDLYAADGLNEAILAHRPGVDGVGLTWQYPPHASLIFSPLGYLPYEVAYAVWCAFGLCVFTAVLIQSGLRGRWLIAALATIPVLTVINTGQNASFTAGLLLLAVLYAKPKPVLAGLAAALLTIKPQLGFLLPVLFIAGGHWRAFIAAALGSIALWGGALLILGSEPWMAFFGFVGTVSGSVSDGSMPLYKMVNVYAAARLAWLPDLLAIGIALSAVLLAIAALVWTTRRTEDPKWRYAVLAAGTLLTAPYSMYYELILLVPAVFFVLQDGGNTGWNKWEREVIAFIMLLTLLVPGPITHFGVSPSFMTSALIGLVIYRRVRERFSTSALADVTALSTPQPVTN